MSLTWARQLDYELLVTKENTLRSYREIATVEMCGDVVTVRFARDELLQVGAVRPFFVCGKETLLE